MTFQADRFFPPKNLAVSIIFGALNYFVECGPDIRKSELNDMIVANALVLCCFSANAIAVMMAIIAALYTLHYRISSIYHCFLFLCLQGSAK